MTVTVAPAVRRYTLAALLVAGAVLYSSWVLAFFVSPGANPFEGFASQLAATDRQYGILYRSGDLLTGIVLTVAAVIGLTLTPRRFLTTVGWAALGVFALGTVADSRVPLRCSRPECEATQVPLTHQWHALTSTVSVTAAVVSAVAFIIALFVHRAPRAMWWAGLTVVVLFLVGTLWMLVGVDDPSGSHSWLGFAQRVELLSMSGWMVLVAATVLDDRTWRGLHGAASGST
ncbi:DUF998 domain-containing protein [Rhodococcus sp. SGAir0479]|uniref:DUF998 domain-containing protein n=1 Tax=Rhodococcus sp. SGAir0479 TaxID=2567884 RepID=UPI0010CCDFA1|nr:DUF998 domain-containing protein [Rhodococcus sp. SGAir0479]QCQ93106.1 DUF998 domain-containing protein [Rhodococcus sp. SGAir0479]